MPCPEPKDGLIVPRLFSRLDAAKDEANDPRPLSDFFNEPALVVLGEPGMGKSTSFFHASREEENAECLNILQFLVKRNLDDLKRKTLFLDGLDEKRAEKANGKEVLYAIIESLKALDRPKFRLSCRTADWFGELDKSELRNASSSGSVTVIRLEPLTGEQVLEIVSARGLDADSFLEQARHSSIEEWITNPQHLEMVLEVVSQGQAWPETRKALFERACLALVREHNRSLRRTTTAPPSERMLQAAGLLCILILRANLPGVALEKANAGDGFPDLSPLPESGLPLVAAARSKLFRHPAPERASYYHRTMAEYLAARFLVHQMANGLPAERVRRLLTTENGLVPSHLRGLHAWVATLCPEPTISLFLKADPMGLALFGDPASLSPSRKGDVLDGISQLAAENPWFRGGHWEDHPLGRLADATMKERFEEMLKEWKNQPSHLLFTLLDIVAHGKSLVVSRQELFNFIKNHEVPPHFRARAASAFIAHCPDALADLKSVLAEHDKHAQPDDEQELRGVLLKVLYPSHLTPGELVGFLPPPPASSIDAYYMFLARGLVEKTPDAQLPALMGALVQNKHRLECRHEGRSAWQPLVGETLARTLEKHGDQASNDLLWDWLSVGADDRDFLALHYDRNNPHAPRVREWLGERRENIKHLFMLWIQRTPVNQLEQDIDSFWGRMQGLDVPSWFPDWCLELAAESLDEETSTALFRIGMGYLLRHPPISSPDSLDRAFSFVERFPRFAPLLKPFLYHKLRDFEWKRIRLKNQENSNRESDKKKIVADLSSHIDGIRDGSDLGVLRYLARIYRGLSRGADQEADPSDRLRGETSPEIAQAAEEGFVRCLANPSLPTPEKIGQAIAENKEYNIGWPVLAAMDLISKSKAEAPTDSEAPYLAALAFQLAISGSEECPLWFTLFIEKFPERAARALSEFWLPQLQARNKNINGLYEIARKEKWSGVAAIVAIPLLRDYHNLDGENLRYLLVAAVKWGDRQALKRLVVTVMGCCKGKVAGWPRWAVVACVLEVVQWSQIEPVFAESDDEAEAFFELFVDLFFGRRGDLCDKPSDLPLKISLLGELLTFFGKRHPPKEWSRGGGWVSLEMKNAERVASMINKLAAEMVPEATAILQSLVDNDALLPWRDRLRHTLAKHRQKMADETFLPLSWEDVFGVIQGGPPATASDLHALVVDQIRSISRELRDGNSDGYKMYWNTQGRHNQTTTPKVEDNSRDRLLEALQHKLAPLPDIHAEPEGRYADDNRADIKILFKDWNIPIEIKQDYHEKVWSAADNQLITQYVRDPGTHRYGIYLVVWYGEHGKGLTKPPPEMAIATPATWQELEDSLQETIPSEYRHSVIVMVLDVSTRKPFSSS